METQVKEYRYIYCSNQYIPEELTDEEIERIVRLMSTSIRHLLKEFSEHPFECEIHEGKRCNCGSR